MNSAGSPEMENGGLASYSKDTDTSSRFNDSSVMYGRMSPTSPDINTLRNENRILKNKVKQLNSDLQTEQDTVGVLRRKLTTLERERLDSYSKSNDEVTRLDSEVTRLRAQIEKGEAIRQNLECELAKAKRDVSHEKRSLLERETMMTEFNDTMKQKVSELTRQVEQLCSELESTKAKAQGTEERLRQNIQDRDDMASGLRAERDKAEADKDKYKATLKAKERSLQELEERVMELEEQHQQQLDSLRRQVGETELVREREDRLRTDLESAQSRVKTLEESIEAERAAHLESKFNSEIIQLRIRDLESALELEKSSKSEMASGKDKLNKQLRDLQKIYEDERKNGQSQEERITQAEKEYAELTRQLQMELTDKREIIKRLSCELDNHAREFGELKTELNKAKKRQVYLEETYSGVMKELELLLDSFRLPDPPKPAAASKKAGSGRLTARSSAASKTTSSKSAGKVGDVKRSPAVIMESLRHMLIAYKRKLDELNTELTKLHVKEDSVSKECTQFKGLVKTKEKALESTQESLAKSSKEVISLRESKRELEVAVRELSTQRDQLQQQVVKVQHDNKALSEQTTHDFVNSLYQQLMAACPPELPPDHWGPYPVSEVTGLVTEQVNRIATTLHRTQARLRELESAAGNKEATIRSLQTAHEEQVSKLSALAEARSQQWAQQRAELEQHYTQLISELQQRQKKTQLAADQAWDKLRSTGSMQQGIEKEAHELRISLLHVQKEHDTLLTGVALLAGALYPLHAHNTALAAQKRVLADHNARLEAFKHGVEKLTDALGEEDETPRRRHRALLGFRAAVVAVMATNRLVNLTKNNCRMFVTKDALPGIENNIVCSGGLENVNSEFTGVSNPWLFERDEHMTRGSDVALNWLTSHDLKSMVMTSVAELQCTLQKAREGAEGVDTRKIIKDARSCYNKLVCQLPPLFPGLPTDPHHGLRERSSLASHLATGLHTRLSDMGGDDIDAGTNSQALLRRLQHHVMAFTERLHAAEVDRRDLRQEVGRLAADNTALAHTHGDVGNMFAELTALRKQSASSVDRAKFESVCGELSGALQREQAAQALLNEQAEQLRELGGRLQARLHDGDQQEHTLAEAVQGLNDARMELKRQEQRVRGLQKQLAARDDEKRHLLENIGDAENALRTASKDRDAVTQYISNVTNALDKVVCEMSSGTLTASNITQLLSPDLLPQNIGKPSRELAACQKLVGDFIESQRALAVKLGAVEAEIEAYQAHIASLKGELAAACRREYDQQLDKIQEDIEAADLDTRPVIGGNAEEKNNGFTPLIEDPNNSDTYSIGGSNGSVQNVPQTAPKTKPNKRELKYQSRPGSGKSGLPQRRKPTEGAPSASS